MTEFPKIDVRAFRRLSSLDRIILTSRRMENGCWDWLSYINPDGYGTTTFQGKHTNAHRVSYVAFRGAIPNGLQIDHLCRNRRCVNPMHLEAVTHRENLSRGNGLTSVNSRKTHCLRGHALAGENLYLTPAGRRTCKTCQRARYLAMEKRNAQ